MMASTPFAVNMPIPSASVSLPATAAVVFHRSYPFQCGSRPSACTVAQHPITRNTLGPYARLHLTPLSGIPLSITSPTSPPTNLRVQRVRFWDRSKFVSFQISILCVQPFRVTYSYVSQWHEHFVHIYEHVARLSIETLQAGLRFGRYARCHYPPFHVSARPVSPT